ncbi:MAG: M81 family metallopeptidase [Acidobacteria bacterium]|nr:M81 family metallopeptidase [Acidobacteriota bacterium]MBI3279347.1 M81 family metallopeptidase [Acidobacteriota bacterium]
MQALAVLLLGVLLATAQTRRPRIAVAGILHESNSFSTVKTNWADFTIRRGPEIAGEWKLSNHEVAGFLAGAEKYDFEMVPVMVASATPSGPVTDDALDRLAGELIERLRAAAPLDGILLALHGAMVTESEPHGDAEILRRLRSALGDKIPIVVTHDFHANIPPEVVERSTALITYKENPHVDQRERGLKAAELLARTVAGKVRPVQRLVKPPMLYNIRFQYTSVPPLRPIVDATRELEKNPKILAASVSGGYQYADVPWVGPSAVVVTDGDPELAEREAKRLSEMLWATRDRLKLELPDAAAAVKIAASEVKHPVVLVEMGDNIGGGSPGDATFLLSELVRQNVSGWVVALADPEAANKAASVGVGGSFDAMVGARTDRLHGDPVRIRGRVKSLHDGRFLETQPRHGGHRYYDQGLTAVIEVEGSTRDLPSLLMLTTRRQVPFSLHQLISCGIYPERQRILVVKAAIAFRAAYEPVAARIIEVDTGGVTAVNPKRFTFRRARRPLFGLD